ncbi:hypothetical protein AQUCO_02100234v1 [Aquilegia coerulea]|uniref:Uncharacterized protein n=1 Tax=Aquilegia coerulea TaxID=218851 RepID=A0A2G5DFC0_AQUCA|nr:hypothetical protein AQUCO_02100234v1 [Aquilegia coerulea]
MLLHILNLCFLLSVIFDDQWQTSIIFMFSHATSNIKFMFSSHVYLFIHFIEKIMAARLSVSQQMLVRVSQNWMVWKRRQRLVELANWL